MERRLKERLVGASILVVLIVLIVPELLSGPKPVTVVPPVSLPIAASPAEPIRNVTVDLATSKAPAAAEPDMASASAPPQASAQAPIAAPAPAPAPATQQSAVESPPSSPISVGPSQADATHRDWAVQLGSFASRVNSDNLVHRLKAQGFAVYELSSGAGRAQRYRVRIGPLNDRATADKTMAKLKSLGLASSIVAPGH